MFSKIDIDFLMCLHRFVHDFCGCSEVKISKCFWNRFSDDVWCGFSVGFGIDFAHFGGLDHQKVDPKAEVIPKVCPRLSEGVSKAVGNQRKPAETSPNQRKSDHPG